MILYGDEIPSSASIAKLLEHRYGWLCKKTERPKSAGIVELRKDGTIEAIIEKSQNPPSDIAAIGAIVVDGRVFGFEPAMNPNGEYYLTSILNQFLKEERVYAVITEGSRSLTTPQDIPIVEKFLKASSRP